MLSHRIRPVSEILAPHVIPTGEQSRLPMHHRSDGKRFVVHADEKLTAFVELEAAIRSSSESS